MTAEARAPLAAVNGSASVVKFVDGSDVVDKKQPPSLPRINAGADQSFSVMSSSRLPSLIVKEQLIMKGAKKKPTIGQTIDTFYLSITHLHLHNMRLCGDVVPITCCRNLRVLYVYDNLLTSLRGLGGLDKLTHLYAQDNRIESLHDFEAPPSLQQLRLGGNRLKLIGGLEMCTNLTELNITGQRPAETKPASMTAHGGEGEREYDELASARTSVYEDGGSDEGVHSARTSVDGYAKGVSPSEGGEGAPSEAPSSPGPPPPDCLSIEAVSLMAIAPTLQKLSCGANAITDDALEPLVMLQNLTSLDVTHNAIESIGRLQQLLLRLPCLGSLSLAGNPVASTPKLRERLIVAANAIEQIDGKQQLGVSIPSAATYDLGRGHELYGEPPAGFYEDTHQPASLGLISGVRRPWSRTPHAA